MLTADTGYSSEANMEYVFGEKINAVIPDNNFRQRDPKFSESESVKKHKTHRQKTRKDKSKGKVIFPTSDFTFNKEAKVCVCPNEHEMMYHGDHFVISHKRYYRFKSYLKNCRGCPLQTKCMRKPVNEHGRQVSFVVDNEKNTSPLCQDSCHHLVKLKI